MAAGGLDLPMMGSRILPLQTRDGCVPEKRIMRGRGWRGGMRRVVTALLALVLLVLPVGPPRHGMAAAAPLEVVTLPASDGPMAAPCPGHAAAHAVPAQTAHHAAPPCHHEDGGPPAGCCAAAGCVGLQGAPPPLLVLPGPLLAVAARPATPPAAPPGRAVPPARKPPRLG
jgi:hypothetical protein